MLRPCEAVGRTPRYLKEEISHWHRDKDLDQPGPPLKASGMISCSRGAAKNRSMCVKDSVENKGGNPVLRKSHSKEEMITKSILLAAIHSFT